MKTAKKTQIVMTLVLFYSHYALATNWCKMHEVSRFIEKIVKETSYTRKELCNLFAHTKSNKEVLKYISAPYEKKPWSHYKTHFITPKRIANGKQYMKKHHKSLMLAEKKYGVPASLVVAILGVETNYGQNMGQYLALETLLTLGFQYPPRSPFFRKELAALLQLTKQDHLRILSIHSSYAGALGIAQFMPSNYHYLGVTSHPKAKLDLFHHHDDAIFSIANFLYKNGWQAHQPILKPINRKLQGLGKTTSEPIKKHSLTLPLQKAIGRHAVALYQPDSKHEKKFILYKNFNVLTSYNHSPQYALAVTLLAERFNTSGIHK